MTIGYRGGANAGNGGASVTINVPAGTVDRDVMIAVIWYDTAAPSTPGGWTRLALGLMNTSAYSVAVYRRVANSEPASYNFPGNTFTFGYIDTFSGVDFNTPENVATPASTDNGTSGTITWPDITTKTPGVWHLAIVGDFTTIADISGPSGYTVRGIGPVNTKASQTASKAVPVGLVTGVTATYTAGSWTAISVALQPLAQYSKGFPQFIKELRPKSGPQPPASSAYAAASQPAPEPPPPAHPQPIPPAAIAGIQPLVAIAWFTEAREPNFSWEPWPQPVPGIPVTGPQPLADIVWMAVSQELQFAFEPWPQPVPPRATAGDQPPNRTWVPSILGDFAYRGLVAPPVPGLPVTGPQPPVIIAWFGEAIPLNFAFEPWPQPIPGPAVAGAQPPNQTWVPTVLADFVWRGLRAPPLPNPPAVAGAQPPNQTWQAVLGEFRDFLFKPWPQPVPPPLGNGVQPYVRIAWFTSAYELNFPFEPWPQPVPPIPVAGPQPPNQTWSPYTQPPPLTSFVPWPHPQPVPGPAVAGAQPQAVNWLTQGIQPTFVWRGLVAPPVPGIPVTGPQALARIAWFTEALELNFSWEPWPQPVPGPAVAGAQPTVETWLPAVSYVPDFRLTGPGPQPVPGPAVAGTQPLSRVAWYLATFLDHFTWRGLRAPKPPDPATAGTQPRTTAGLIADKGQPPVVSILFRRLHQPVPPEATAGTQPHFGASSLKPRFLRLLIGVTRYFAREEPALRRAVNVRADAPGIVQARVVSRRSYSVRIASTTRYQRVVGVEESVTTVSTPRVLSNNIWQHSLTDNLSGGIVTGATMRLTVTDPNGSTVLNNVLVPEVGVTGVYRYESVGSVCQVAGIYTATWAGIDLAGKDIHRVDLVQVTLA